MTQYEKHFLKYANEVKELLYPHRTNLTKIKISSQI